MNDEMTALEQGLTLAVSQCFTLIDEMRNEHEITPYVHDKLKESIGRIISPVFCWRKAVFSELNNADGQKPGVDADEAHTLLAQLQEALQSASTAAAAIVGLLEGYERTAKEANAKLDRLREFLKKEGGE